MKLLVTERKVREYTELDSVPWTELLVSKGELQNLLPQLITDVHATRDMGWCDTLVRPAIVTIVNDEVINTGRTNILVVTQ